jgi:hypothetical protein
MHDGDVNVVSDLFRSGKFVCHVGKVTRPVGFAAENNRYAKEAERPSDAKRFCFCAPAIQQRGGGTEEEKQRAFNKAFRELDARLMIFTSLRVDMLDRLSLQNALDAIGRTHEEAEPE